MMYLHLGMFDQDSNGTVNFEEFCALWKYVTDWLNCFKSFDKDNSGTIDKNELKTAFSSFGMNIFSYEKSIIWHEKLLCIDLIVLM